MSDLTYIHYRTQSNRLSLYNLLLSTTFILLIVSLAGRLDLPLLGSETRATSTIQRQ
jgi:hypothetical protein